MKMYMRIAEKAEPKAILRAINYYILRLRGEDPDTYPDRESLIVDILSLRDKISEIKEKTDYSEMWIKQIGKKVLQITFIHPKSTPKTANIRLGTNQALILNYFMKNKGVRLEIPQLINALKKERNSAKDNPKERVLNTISALNRKFGSRFIKKQGSHRLFNSQVIP